MLEYSSISSGQARVIFRWDICFVNLVLLSGSLIRLGLIVVGLSVHLKQDLKHV